MSKTMTNKEFNKSKEEKRQMFFDMQEHPDRYTDEQMERLLADEDVKDLFHDMAMVRMAMKKGNPKKVNVDEAWKKFAYKQGLKANEASDKTSSYHWKIAASIIVLIRHSQRVTFINSIVESYFGIRTFRAISHRTSLYHSYLLRAI